MNYPLKSSNLAERKKQSLKKTFLLILFLTLIILLLVLKPVREGLFFLATPIWQVKNYLLNINLENLKSKQVLLQEKNSLLTRIDRADTLISLNEVLMLENEKLKDLLGRKVITNTILGVILVKPPKVPYDELIIDIGADQGIMVGNKVLADTNIYIGEIGEVYKYTSRVILYSTPGKKLPVVLGINSIMAEAVGMGGGNFTISLPREIEIREGDIVVIPSITPNVFGIVEKIEVQERDSVQIIYFKNPINISELAMVEVIK